jgi:hypothetical protein
MRFGISLIALFALGGPVLAQTIDCQSIQKAKDRLIAMIGLRRR